MTDEQHPRETPDEVNATSGAFQPSSPLAGSPSTLDHYYRQWGHPTAIWGYFDETGRILGYVRRYDPARNRKQFLPLTPAEENGRLVSRPKGWDSPRPLFGLDRLAARPNAPVLVTEGEKAAVGLNGKSGALALVATHVSVASPYGPTRLERPTGAPFEIGTL
jgi:hypothetical protein